jgi:hypothetical protein
MAGGGLSSRQRAMAKAPSLTASPVTRAVFRTDLPAPLCREIGRIITRWAYLENAIQHTLRTLLGLSEEEGRLVLQKAGLNEQLDVIADLAYLYRLKVDATALKRMKAAIEKTIEFRNVLAHGAWSHDANHQRWAVTQTARSWADEGAPKTERKKKVNPEGLLTDVDTMRRTIRDIDALIAQTKELYTSLQKQIDGWRDAPPSPSDGLAYERARRSSSPGSSS